jgi:primosomal protein N' (replication factor Y)
VKKDSQNSLFAGMDDAAEAKEAARIRGPVVRVALDTGADALFDYRLPEHLGTVEPGRRVEVPFGKGNRLEKGFVVEELAEADKRPDGRGFRLKAVKRVIDDEPLVAKELFELAKWISRYYVCPLGQVLSAMVPAAVKQDAGVRTKLFVSLSETFNEEVKLSSPKQKALVEILRQAAASNEETAMDKETLLESADCTDAPLKQLVRKGLAAIWRRAVLQTLPSVPNGLALESGSVTLNDDQQKALSHIAAQVESGAFGVTLLHGVTDSGKTEVYIRAIEACVTAGRQAIVLLPEIALTAQTVQRFHTRFERLAILHSQQTAPQRNAHWQTIRNGQADVVIGARSAIFAPLSRLGLVVVDEEHEPSYKQDTAPRYHGRDVAVMRAHFAGAHCVLGSATPSLESLENCRTKKHYTLVEMPRRVRDLPLPEMRLVNMAGAFHDTPHKGVNLLSPELTERLKGVLSRKEQAILLLNRRGYSNYVFCPSCRHSLHCRNCDVTLTFHKRPKLEKPNETLMGKHIVGGYAICHYCMAKTLVPQACPLCGTRMIMIGLGSQRLEEEVAAKLPQARVRRIDSDAMAGEDYYRLLREFAEGKIDILAGTQMLAKGLHFPNVTLVGVVSADTALSLPDFRANERTFQLISQVAGRAGRSEKPGVVVVQTFLPGQPAIEFALRNDYKGFVEEELKHRLACTLPPYWRLAILQMRDEHYDRLTAAAEQLRLRVDHIVDSDELEIKRRGPMPAPIERIQRHHRMQIILQAPSPTAFDRLFERMRRMPPVRPIIQIQADIDPIYVL